ncbi:MAG: hypothetical protein EZS28_030034 [Streblomastix strix]|uniref:Uncharacterized protein n=1 Tax=Streblomastix strix TaxID=222440 RepID=A0A5J4UVE3_9EUKA|nr:MAG: hypothetical protein EZS28_030034 [Streblomastix strix]
MPVSLLGKSQNAPELLSTTIDEFYADIMKSTEDPIFNLCTFKDIHISRSKNPNLRGNCFRVFDQLFFITQRKIASGPSYFTPANTVSSITITALNEFLIIGFVDTGI